MNSSEAAELLNILHGAFPGTYFDGSVAEVFSNSFITNDYEASKQAVHDWVARVDHFPTIAELNAAIRRLKGRDTDGRALTTGRAEPPDVATIERAKLAFSDGYRRQRSKMGDTPEQIEVKLAGYMRKFPGSVLGVGA
jgi:hypothetical protein